MAWRKKELEDNSLCYTCHLCPFETHFVLDFELHISLHQEFVKSIGCAVDDVRATKAKLKPRGRIILDDSDTEQSIISGKSESRSTPALKYSSESEHGDDPVEVIAISGSESQPSPASDKNEVNTSTSANIGSDATQVTATRDDENGVRLGNCANTHQNEKNCVRPRKQTDKRPDTRYHCPYCPFSSLLCDFLDHITKQHKESENEFVIACSKTAKTKKRAVVGVRDFMKAPLKNCLGDFLKLHGIKKLRTSSTDSIIIVPSTDIVPLSGQTEDILTPGSIVTSDENESLTRKRPLSTDEGDDYSRKRICVKNEASPADLCMTWVFEHDDCDDETSLDDVIVKVHFNNESYFADCLRQCEVNHSNGSHSDVKHILSDAAISDVDDGSVEDVADQMYVTDSDDGSSSDDEEKAKMAAYFSDIVQYINPSNC